jgi:hypothetical protein
VVTTISGVYEIRPAPAGLVNEKMRGGENENDIKNEKKKWKRSNTV